MILFPIALIWVAVVLIWIIRKSTNAPDLPAEGGDGPRRFRPRVPRGPREGRPGRVGRASSRSR